MLNKFDGISVKKAYFLLNRSLVPAMALAMFFVYQSALAGPDANEYVQKFMSYYSSAKPSSDRPLQLEEFASKATYDSIFMGSYVKNAVDRIHQKQNKASDMAWGTAYFSQSLNYMYQATRDPNYLAANLEIVRASFAERDDKHGVKTFFGEVAPAWGCELYAQRWTVHAVHTGIIVLPIIDFLNEIKADKHLRSDLKIDDNEFRLLVSQAAQSLDWHERQWRDGPGDQEGFYRMKDEEKDFDPNLPQPFNRLSMMGAALWESWKLTGNVNHREKAIKLARYIKRRLTIHDQAYYWEYWLPQQPVDQAQDHKILHGEDISHGGLSICFPLRLAKEIVVFTHDDIKLFSKTVLKGFARLNDGVLLGTITGNNFEFSPGALSNTGYYIPCSEADRDVYNRIAEFLVKYQKLRPLELAALIKYRSAVAQK